MTGVAIAHESFVMTAASTERAGPAGVAIGFRLNVPAIQEVGLLLFVEPGCDVSEFVLIGIDEAMAGSDVAGRSDAQEAKASSTRMRLVHTLMQLRERIADVGKAVQFAAKSEGEIFLGEFAELRENLIHASHTHGVQPIRRIDPSSTS